MARQRNQQQIPGTERVEIPEVEEAAEEYRTYRDDRMELGEKEKQAKAKLIEMMGKHGQTTYMFEDDDGVQRKVTIVPKVNVKVSKVKETSADSDVDVQVD